MLLGRLVTGLENQGGVKARGSTPPSSAKLRGYNMTKIELIRALQSGAVKVTFVKADKSIRTMVCTLNLDSIKDFVPSFTTNTNFLEDNTTVWDIENNGWRSFKYSSITDVELCP